MPTSARASQGFFGQLADVGIRAPEQNGLLQHAPANLRASKSTKARGSAQRRWSAKRQPQRAGHPRSSKTTESFGPWHGDGVQLATCITYDTTDVALFVSGGTPPYQLQVRADLTAGSWQNLGATFTITSITFSATNQSQSFYRVVGQ
jgi:hypothetical protein